MISFAWWRHQMETFPAILTLCAENSPVTGEFPSQRTVTRSFNVFFDLRLNKVLSKQSSGWLFQTPSRSLWRHCNYPPELSPIALISIMISGWLFDYIHSQHIFDLQLNTPRSRQNGRQFVQDIFNVFLKGNLCILIKIHMCCQGFNQ